MTICSFFSSFAGQGDSSTHFRSSSKFCGLVPSLKLHGNFSPVAIVSLCAQGQLLGTGNLCLECFVMLTDTLVGRGMFSKSIGEGGESPNDEWGAVVCPVLALDGSWRAYNR